MPTTNKPKKPLTRDNYKKIRMADIDPPHESIRTSISPEAISELTTSLSAQGLLQPIVVRPSNGRYEIIAGHRRYLAASNLGWAHIFASVRSCNDTETQVLKATENLLRVDLSLIEEAKAYRVIIDNHHMSIDELAKKTGKTADLIRRRLDLLKMPANFQDAIHARKITYSVAEELFRIPEQSARDYYLGYAIDHGVTSMVARDWANEYRKSQLSPNPDYDPGNPLASCDAFKPIYLSCDFCQQAVQLGKDRTLRACPDCLKQLSDAHNRQSQ